MWIFLAILKWIGILLGAILGLCLLLTVLVVLVPVRYRIQGSKKKEVVYSFTFSWLFSILSVKKKEHTDIIRLYLFGIPLRCLAGEEKGKEREKKERSGEEKNTAEEDRGKCDPEEQAGCPEKKTASRRPKSSARKQVKGKKKKKKKNFSFRKVSSIIDFVKQDWNVMRRLFREGKELVRYLSPTKVRGELVLGTGDPASTGLVFGGLSLFPVFYQDGVRITPDFDEKRFEANGMMRGRLRLLYFLRLLLRLYKDSELKRLWKHINQVKKEAA